MIKINLLPYHEIAKKKTYLRQVVFMISGAVVFLLCLVMGYIWMLEVVEAREKELKSKEARLAMLTKMVGEVERIKGEKQALEKKLAVITQLERGRSYTVRLLADVADHVPAGDVWLEKLVQTESKLEIEGKARDNFAVVHLMKNLESSPFINTVELGSSKLVEEAGIKLQQFRITCNLRRA